ncbi:MAG: dUTP diphosphatase [Solirubrobacterales bacterium]
MQIKFKKLSPSGRLPGAANPGDAGVDLHAAEDAHIGPGERWKVGTGIAVEIPPGHAGLVLPRSGLANRHGIALVNSPGLVDSGYRGEIGVLLLNTDPAEIFRVSEGDRIAQLMVTPYVEFEPVEADDLSPSERGSDGFGSSGS